jgi:hypothetical protein
MTRRSLPIAGLLIASFAGASCGGDSSTGNPDVLWLAPLNGEVDVQLVGSQPPNY